MWRRIQQGPRAFDIIGYSPSAILVLSKFEQGMCVADLGLIACTSIRYVSASTFSMCKALRTALPKHTFRYIGKYHRESVRRVRSSIQTNPRLGVPSIL